SHKTSLRRSEASPDRGNAAEAETRGASHSAGGHRDQRSDRPQWRGFDSKRKTVLTHCNAGALATAGYGTALGVIRAAVAAGKRVDVFADETRPFLQGARLTVWELQHDGIPATLITD